MFFWILPPLEFTTAPTHMLITKIKIKVSRIFNIQNFFWIYIIFLILTLPKNLQKKFQRHSLLATLHWNLRMRTKHFFGFVLFWHRWNVGLMKLKNCKNEIILKLPPLSFAPGHRIFNFSWTPYCTCSKYHFTLRRTLKNTQTKRE